MKILLLEDDLVDRMAFSRWVKKEFNNFQIHPATTLEEAKSLWQQEAFDLLVSDYFLPDGHLPDLLTIVDPKRIVCISGLTNPHQIESLKEAAISHFFFKDNHLKYLEQFKFYILLFHFSALSTPSQSGGVTITNEHGLNLSYLKKAFDFKDQPIKEIIEAFLMHTPKQLARLKEAVRDENSNACNYIAHQLKSSFRMMGLFAQMEKLQEIEIVCCRDIKNTAFYMDLVQEIQQDSVLAFQQLEKELKAF